MSFRLLSLFVFCVLVLSFPVPTLFAAFADEYEYVESRAWGGTGVDEANSTFVSDTGDVYSVGYFRSTVDFDDTGGTDERTSAGGQDIFLTKYNSDGTYAWTRTWGGTGDDLAYGIVSDNENLYITGSFSGTVDFDAGAGADQHTSAGGVDVFLTAYDTDGNYGWTRAWGGTGTDRARGVTIDNSLLYLTGWYAGTVNFDDTGGTDNHVSTGGNDAFLTVYNTDGNYSWTRTWGGSGYDGGVDIVVSGTQIFVGGIFSTTVNFDDTGGTDQRTVVGGQEAFLTSYNTDSSYGWTRAWGSSSHDGVNSVTVVDDIVYSVGYFFNTVDFDDTGGTDEYTSAGGWDVFLTAYNTDGSYSQTIAWGGTGYDMGQSTAYFGDNVFISGYYQGTVDFDPTGSTDEYTAAGSGDVYLTIYNTNGEYVETEVFSTTGYANGMSIFASNNSLVVGGNFTGTISLGIEGSVEKTSSGSNNDTFYTKYQRLIYGCTDEGAQNYNAEANRDDASCIVNTGSTESSTSVQGRVSNILGRGDTGAIGDILKKRNINIDNIRNDTERKIVIEVMQVELNNLLKKYKEKTGRDFVKQLPSVDNIALRNLTIGSTGTDVTALQNLLLNNNYNIPAGVTGYFGQQTQSALSKFQLDNNITPSTGYFGAITQSFMKKLGIKGVWW